MTESENNKELKKEIDKMELSAILKRLEEIDKILKTNSDNAIDKMIPLLEETKLLKLKADKMVGEIDAYLLEQSS